MNTLYELSTEFSQLMELADDPDCQDAFVDTLEGMQYEIGKKVDGYAVVFDELKNQSAKIGAEIKRLQGMKKACDNAQERMKQTAKAALENAGVKEFKSDLHKIRLCKAGGAAPLEIDEEQVPESYKQIVLVTDKEKIKKELGEGKELPFARYKERGTYAKIQ